MGAFSCRYSSPTLPTESHHRSISLWSTQKKKPVYVQALAHGLHETVSEERGTVRSPRWITAIGSLHYSDLFASGKGITARTIPSDTILTVTQVHGRARSSCGSWTKN